ncbi:zf-HC2 domain-containing protein [Actinospongicola halichondriae]|uniref:zf-HC2 domain-containing protein n=1 Tax=Actinospongicola halichondriae TaxID=3236844 RepID=UPI003D52D482
MQQYDELLHDRSGRAALVERAVTGDEDAFRALYEKHAVTTWRLAYALTGTTRDAVEVVSESFARTFTSLRAERISAGDFTTALLRQVRHHAIDVRRAQGDTPAPFETSEKTLVLATAFASLPERWRAALWLSQVEKCSVADAAAVVELDADATVKIASRARRGLREQYLHADTRGATGRNCGRAVSRLNAYVAGSLPGADVEKLERHLRLCSDCNDRYQAMASLTKRLPMLVPALPAMLEDDVRIAWTGAVATASGLGLSRFGEKVLAGVAAVAAGVGVLGAAMVSVANSGGDDEAVAPIAPIVTELAAPRPTDLDLTIDLDPNGTSGTSGTRSFGTADEEFDGVKGASARNGRDDAVLVDLGEDEDSGTTPPGGGTPIDSGGGTTPPPTTTPPGGGSSDPVVEIGTDVGGVPIAVEVGSDPGVTVGPISVGSEPQPGGGTIGVGGPLAPLAPIVEPIDKGLTGLLGG